jgi:hypothetical protein
LTPETTLGIFAIRSPLNCSLTLMVSSGWQVRASQQPAIPPASKCRPRCLLGLAAVAAVEGVGFAVLFAVIGVVVVGEDISSTSKFKNSEIGHKSRRFHVKSYALQINAIYTF